MTLLSALPCVDACGSLTRRLRRKHGHILAGGSLPPCCWGWWVALLVSPHTLCYCQIHMLLLKCCQPLVANCTTFLSVVCSSWWDPRFLLLWFQSDADKSCQVKWNHNLWFRWRPWRHALPINPMCTVSAPFVGDHGKCAFRKNCPALKICR